MVLIPSPIGLSLSWDTSGSLGMINPIFCKNQQNQLRLGNNLRTTSCFGVGGLHMISQQIGDMRHVFLYSLDKNLGENSHWSGFYYQNAIKYRVASCCQAHRLDISLDLIHCAGTVPKHNLCFPSKWSNGWNFMVILYTKLEKNTSQNIYLFLLSCYAHLPLR